MSQPAALLGSPRAIPPGELRRAVNAWARRGLRARWPLRLVCLARPVTLAEVFAAARAEGDEQTARELATEAGWLTRGAA